MNYKIIGKYIKHIKFEIPNPKTFFLLSKDIANYKINVEIKSNQVKFALKCIREQQVICGAHNGLVPSWLA